ncbi:AzlC family ABC transporter permease [Trujillonella humicola]|uniref:AzlC family ABC transporter permease n=1 Tax=Trujillonella humicola TaxID=3383699 RepID=UPI003906954B
MTAAPAAPAWPWPAALRSALADLGPSLVAVAPLGLVVGGAVGQTGIGAPLGLGGGAAIFAGTAQLSTLTLLHAGAGVLAVVGSVLVVNARLLLYAAALEPHFRAQPRWFRLLGPHLLVDQTFALATARGDLADPARFRRYWLATGSLLGAARLGLIGVGIAVGPALATAGAALAFAPAALFLTMLVPRLTAPPAVVGAGTAGVVTAVLAHSGALPAGLPVLAGAVAGVLAAASAERRPS